MAKLKKDGAYLERSRLIVVLTKIYPSGTRDTDMEGWSNKWHGCVYVDLPTGQVSWHYHTSHAYLFEHLPPYTTPYDGHTTDEKYRRLAAITQRHLTAT